MSRSFVVSSVLVAVAACSLLTAPQASARALGSVSIDTSAPPTPTPWDPWGGVYLCTAFLRKADPSVPGGWLYHMSSGYDSATCWNDTNIWLNPPNYYGFNPNPGFSPCECHSGFNGFLVLGPSGNGPLGAQDLTLEQIQKYDDGMQKLREKYQLDKFAEEHEQLLQSIQAAPAEPDGQ